MLSSVARSVKFVAKSVLPSATRQSIRRAFLPDERHQYLREKGWYESTKSRRSTDANGNPVPWITYPCRAMLERVVRPSDSVFEFGSGYSSLWWAARAK